MQEIQAEVPHLYFEKLQNSSYISLKHRFSTLSHLIPRKKQF